MKRLILTLTGVFALVSEAFAQISPGPITSLPVTLTDPGYYYLTPQAVAQTLTAPGYAIEINVAGLPWIYGILPLTATTGFIYTTVTLRIVT